VVAEHSRKLPLHLERHQLHGRGVECNVSSADHAAILAMFL
jgi:hypothetical protein